VRTLFVEGTLTESGALSDALGLAGARRLGAAFRGAYVEAAYDVLPSIVPGARWALLPYMRWEESDTQEDVDAAGSDDPAQYQRTLTMGLAAKPHPNVVVKADRQSRHTGADTGVGQWNLALGWMF
jgi:hypothetical protein